MEDFESYVTESGRADISAGSMHVSMRAYLSSHHLWAAKHFRELTELREKAISRKPVFDIEHRSYATGSILFSVAFLEAAINEFYQDSFDQHDSYLKPLEQDSKQRLSYLWRLTEENNKSPFSILEKYQLALVTCGKQQLSVGDRPYQDVALVIKLRNELVHYKPKSLGAHRSHKLEKQLRGKFAENQLMSTSNNPYFPDKCLGAGCAGWAVKAVEDFANEFFASCGLKPNYQSVSFNVVGTDPAP